MPEGSNASLGGLCLQIVNIHVQLGTTKNNWKQQEN